MLPNGPFYVDPDAKSALQKIADGLKDAGVGQPDDVEIKDDKWAPHEEVRLGCTEIGGGATNVAVPGGNTPRDEIGTLTVLRCAHCGAEVEPGKGGCCKLKLA